MNKKAILSKKINYETHPSISWKLSSIQFMINKETNEFKFNQISWKLMAKLDKDENLKIYIKIAGLPNSTPTPINKKLSDENENENEIVE